MIAKVLKSPITWVIILLLVFVVYYEFKHRSDLNLMKKQLTEEVNKRVKQIDDQRKVFEQNYNLDKKKMEQQLTQIQKDKIQLQKQIKDSEKKINEIKETHLDRNAIDNLLNEYYNRSSVDPNK